MYNDLSRMASAVFLSKTPNSKGEIERFIQEGIGGFMIGKGGEIATGEQRALEGNSEESLIEFVDFINKSSVRADVLPLYLAIDGEGGRYFNRLKDLANLRAPREYGLQYEESGEIASFVDDVSGYAGLMKRIGLNMNFAPLLDCAGPGYTGYVAEERVSKKQLAELTDSESFAASRAYSDKPETVTALALEAERVFREHGVVCTLKHFPTYGPLQVDQNPHEAVLTLNLSMSELEKELQPYQTAVANDCPAIMVGHVKSPIDKNQLATLSLRNRNYIREKLGFQGLLVADELNMGAIRQTFGPDYIVKVPPAAIQATDVLLISHPETFIPMRDALVAAAENDPRVRSRLVEAFEFNRVFKEKYLLNQR